MPVANSSRYAGLTVYSAPRANGKSHPTIPLRPQPAPSSEGSFRHIVTGAETLESLAWRYFSVSEFWWRIADLNPLVFPLDIRTGTAVTTPSGSQFGTFIRERSFGA
jgi:hypothetical protein